MFSQQFFARLVQLASPAVVLIAASLLMQDTASAQIQRAVIGGGRPDTCVLPPRPCCSPKLGFVGQVNCHGMIVQHVKPRSLACRAGLEPGDIIRSVNGRRIRSHEQFRQLLQVALLHHGGRATLMVKNVRPYPPVVPICINLRHTCHGGGVGHFGSGGVGH